MNHYAYAFRCEQRGTEIFFVFPKFPEIISSLSAAKFRSLSQDKRLENAQDALLSALQLKMSSREEIPESDKPGLLKAGLNVALTVPQAMKLELYRVYLGSGSRSVAEFARSLGKGETLVRRLFDLRHPSQPKEIEEALSAMGKRLVHRWDLEDGTPTSAQRPRSKASRVHPRHAPA